MVDEADNEGELPTPRAPALTGRVPDQTIKLDRAIVAGSLSLPTHFGRYRVLSRIGLGGFASVYAAHDPELDSTVAIKVLAENHSANKTVRQRFVAEARVARRLGSDRLIGVFDLGETDDGRPYVVMELSTRGTLRQRVVRTGRPSTADLIRLIDELGACMTAVHDKGIVHRDIKPSNLLFRTNNHDADFSPTRLIEDDERLVLADFGLARDISDGVSGLTVGGGTEGYMAPEQADPQGRADQRADIYAATVVVAELTTGRRPERLDLTTADISTDVLAVLTQGMATDRDKRPATAADWASQLAAAYRLTPGPGGGGPPFLAGGSKLATAPLDPTRIRAPYPYGVADETAIPETGVGEPVTFAARPDPDVKPPPPPGLPLESHEQPPPPRPEPRPPRPMPLADAAVADPARSELHDAAVADLARAAQADAAVADLARAAQADAVVSSQPISRPTPPPPLDRSPPAPPEQLRDPSPPVATPADQYRDAPPPPPTRSRVSPAPLPPPSDPGPLGAAPTSASKPSGFAPVHPPGLLPDLSPAEVATARSKQHLRTAHKLAKMERRQAHKRARKAARRRRRLLVVNFFLSLIRGALGALVVSVAATVVAAMITGGGVQQSPQAQGLVGLVTILGFLWGMAYFPVPRPRDV
jgi:serine/threonine protein kinase